MLGLNSRFDSLRKEFFQAFVLETEDHLLSIAAHAGLSPNDWRLSPTSYHRAKAAVLTRSLRVPGDLIKSKELP
jgi:hypothetical protein